MGENLAICSTIKEKWSLRYGTLIINHNEDYERLLKETDMSKGVKDNKIEK